MISFSLVATCLLAFLHVRKYAVANQNPCHKNKSNKASACQVIQIPPGMCLACGGGTGPVDTTGNYLDCTKTSDISNPQCISLLQDFVNINTCDTPRKTFLANYLNVSSNATTKESARSGLDYLVYAICEQSCDCLPENSTDPRHIVFDAHRGNCQAHAYWDPCKNLYPNIKLMLPNTTYDPAQLNLLPLACPLVTKWFKSNASLNWVSNGNTTVEPAVADYLFSAWTATGIAKSRDFSDRCVDLESSQQRISLVAPYPSAAPSHAKIPSMNPSSGPSKLPSQIPSRKPSSRPTKLPTPLSVIKTCSWINTARNSTFGTLVSGGTYPSRSFPNKWTILCQLGGSLDGVKNVEVNMGLVGPVNATLTSKAGPYTLCGLFKTGAFRPCGFVLTAGAYTLQVAPTGYPSGTIAFTILP